MLTYYQLLFHFYRLRRSLRHSLGFFTRVVLVAVLVANGISARPPLTTHVFTAGITETAPIGAYWHLARIGVPVALAHGADGHGEKILVIDTGLDDAIASIVLTNTTRLPNWTFSSAYPVLHDDVGHGTFVFSEVLRVAPRARVAMARVFGANGGANSADISHAIYWGIHQHMNVISMSLGSVAPDTGMAQAVVAASRAGILVFCASGNDGTADPHYPAADPGCQSVGATDFSDAVSAFSDFGDSLFITAPGEYISGFLPLHKNLIGGYGFATLSGTSMATPLVAAAAADLLSLGLSPQLALAALRVGARQPTGYTKFTYGAGVLDLTGALRVLGKL